MPHDSKGTLWKRVPFDLIWPDLLERRNHPSELQEIGDLKVSRRC